MLGASVGRSLVAATAVMLKRLGISGFGVPIPKPRLSPVVLPLPTAPAPASILHLCW